MRTTQSISQIINDFLRETNVNEKSKKVYSVCIRLFIRWCQSNGKDIQILKKSDIVEYRNWLLSGQLSTLTAANYFTVVRIFFKWLEEKQYYSFDITHGVKPPKKDRFFKKDILTPDQIRILLSVPDQNTPTGKRDFALLNLMVRTGIRTIEAERANIGDITTREGHSVLMLQRKGKFDKSDMIALSEKTLNALHEYLLTRGSFTNTDPLFVYHGRQKPGERMKATRINLVVKKYLATIGIVSKSYTAHSLRHTAACIALEAGASVYEVAAMLGHSQISTSEIYLKQIQAKKKLVNGAVQRLNDLF